MSSSVDVICVDPKRIGEVWPHVEHFIRFAMQKGRLSEFDDVKRSVFSGSALLWVITEDAVILGAGVTELSTVHGEKFCTIVACGGRDKDRWLATKERIERYARDEGCHTMRIYGRRGWAREFPDYKLSRVLLEKELI
jgi:hypothetical protein